MPYETLAIGAGIQLFEVTTVGQPFEVIKTHLAAYRQDSLMTAVRKTYLRGGLAGFYQGLIPWAWIEASSKGAILFWAQSEVSHYLTSYAGVGHTTAGLLGGACGGVAQAYTTMGFCTLMKTVEVTRAKAGGIGAPSLSTSGAAAVKGVPSTVDVAKGILRKEGIVGMYRGVNALALRQFTNWGSRFGISRGTEQLLKGDDASRKLTPYERLGAAAVGGTLACWNHPIEVIRIELQRHDVDTGGAARSRSIIGAARRVFETGGVPAFFRGVTPRVGHSMALTILMVYGGDELKAHLATKRESNR